MYSLIELFIKILRSNAHNFFKTIRRFEFTLHLPLELLGTNGEVAVDVVTLVLTVDLVVVEMMVLSAAVEVVVVVVDGGTYGANS